jgi:GNAT superfamily N-acetyltransferase
VPETGPSSNRTHGGVRGGARRAVRIARRLLVRSRRSHLSRAARRAWMGEVSVERAGAEERAAIAARRSPSGHPVEFPGRTIVLLVARGRGRRLLGWVYVVLDTAAAAPMPGYWIYGLLVRPRYRFLGLGGQLVGAAVDTARDLGAGKLKLLVAERNQVARRLYASEGFLVDEGAAPAFLARREETISAPAAPKAIVMSVSLDGTRSREA